MTTKRYTARGAVDATLSPFIARQLNEQSPIVFAILRGGIPKWSKTQVPPSLSGALHRLAKYARDFVHALSEDAVRLTSTFWMLDSIAHFIREAFPSVFANRPVLRFLEDVQFAITVQPLSYSEALVLTLASLASLFIDGDDVMLREYFTLLDSEVVRRELNYNWEVRSL